MRTEMWKTKSGVTQSVQFMETAADVDAARQAIEDVFDGWFADVPRIDWEDFFDRLDRYGYTFEELDSPVERRIRAIVRELRRDHGGLLPPAD